MRYRHIIWDWNGTLLDDLDLCVEAMNGILTRRGLPPLTRTRYHELFGFPVCDYYARLGFDPKHDSFERLSVEFIAAYNAQRFAPRLHPGVETILAAVRQSGATQSILSAYEQNGLVEVVRHYGLERYFIRLTGLDNIYAHSKVESGRAWMKELALPLPEVVFVGDTLHDLEVAEAIGVDCVLISHGHHPNVRLSARCAHVVPDLAALGRWLGLPEPATRPTPLPAPSAAAAGRGSPAGSA